ncbi:MAG: signal peptidase I [Pirellula sp.]|nr:signal peptidase I [Pirellula sp.]
MATDEHNTPASSPPSTSAEGTSADAGKAAVDRPGGEPAPPSKGLVFRETVESLAVAFILALLFKAFIAEAFVIPTGSMAPTLMGAHKDVVCESCGFQYQCGASSEYSSETGARIAGHSVVGTVCPLCRKPQGADPTKNANQATFTGDRILVSKLAYVWNSPRRWDVIVFKFLENARQNYIKRCIGLPNETIRITEGDIYVRRNDEPNKPFEIARKPPNVLGAMLQPVSDTHFIPKPLVKAGMPSLWQPLSPEDKKWTVQWDDKAWSAVCKNETKEASWLRYYHRVVDPAAWNYIQRNGVFPARPDARQPRLIMDFTAYNASYIASTDPTSDRFSETVVSTVESKEPRAPGGSDGIHWTGDVAGEFEFETSAGSQVISLLLVESGAKHLVDINLADGKALARIEKDGQLLNVFESNGELVQQIQADTRIRSGKKHRVKLSNVDDQIVLWVDGAAVEWSPSNRINWSDVVGGKPKGPTATNEDPLDGAPIGISIAGGELRLSRAKVFRDIYYIAQGFGQLHDYPNLSETLRNSLPPGSRETYAQNSHSTTYDELLMRMGIESLDRNVLAELPKKWGESALTTSRRIVDFPMKEGWYFPLGDNSAASSDARSWAENHTPARLMIGRAVIVFWPHVWNAPVPFLPNVQRMGLIR